MNAIRTIALREWRAMFLSPLAWTLLAVLFAICAYMFNAALVQYQLISRQFQMSGATDGLSLTDLTVAPLFGNAAVLLLLLMPLITMRLVAEEKRRETWPALAVSPISPLTIIIGKYVGLLLFLLVTIGLLALMPLSLLMFGNPDLGQILSGVFGLFLVAATFGAVGLAASSSTENPMVAAVFTFGVLLLLWIAGWMGESGGSGINGVLAYLSLLEHYRNFLEGVVSSTDLAYFFIVSAAGLTFARQRLVAERLQGF